MRSMYVVTVVLALAVSAVAQGGRRDVKLARYGLSLQLPELDELEQVRGTDRIYTWVGKHAGSAITIRIDFMPRKEYRLTEPPDVLGVIAFNRQRVKKGFKFDDRSLRKGKYGFIPYASIASSEERAAGETSVASQNWFLGGILKQHGYSVEISCIPGLPKTKAKAILAFLETGISYDGEVRDGKWSKKRCQERWTRDAPESTWKKLKIIRTKHYVILTNSSGGNLFAKKMEEFYKKIRKIYPFDEVAGQELMPVFLFRSNEEYYSFYGKMVNNRTNVRASKGHAWKDYYATWYESPNDPVHIHEATHQIFMNRLHLTGAGSWFQEGVAEYMSSKKNDRNVVRRQIKRGTFTSLKKMMTISSLLYASGGRTARGRDLGRDNYTQAALIIEFFRESKLGRKKFQDFIHAMGQTPRNDVQAIEAVLKRLFGKDISEIEAAFVKYCSR